MIGELPQLLAILINIVSGFVNAPGFKVGKSLNINFVGLTSFSVGAGF